MFSSTVHRALVTYSNTTTGEIRVKIPSLIGVSDEVPISYIGRSSSNDYWAVPKIGDQIVVTSDDANLTNVFWVQTEPYNPGTKEPTGFSNRLDSTISFDNATRTFTISPVDDQFEVWVRGIKYEIREPLSVVISNTHGGHNIYFDAAGELQTKTTFFDLEWEAPVSFIYWNTTSQIMFSDERHGTTMDWQTHEYFHRTQGAQFASGFAVSGYTTSGTGNSVADGKISIANGTFFDEDLQIDITHSATPVVNTWQQRLQSGAYIPVYYSLSAGWQKTTATQYPFKFGTTYPQYNSSASSLTEMGNNKYGISWILATNGLNEPIIAVMGQHEYSNIGDAHSALWSDVLTPNFPAYEFRPLWKIIFQAVSGTAIKVAIRQLDDLRSFKGTATSGGTIVTALDNLVDVTLTSPSINNSLSYNGSQWVNVENNLNNLSDVEITSPITNNVLSYNGSQWVNTPQTNYPRNVIINGGMSIYQRAYSSTPVPDVTYVLDRWVYLGDGITASVGRNNGDSTVSAGSYSMGILAQSPGKKFGVVQHIEKENIVGLKNNLLTLSFKMFVTNNSMNNIKAAVISWSGTADAVTRDVVSSWNSTDVLPTLASGWSYCNTPVNLFTSSFTWTNCVVTATPTEATVNNLAVFIWSDTTNRTGGTLYISEVQLEKGQKTPFEQRPIGAELALCQRYYWRSGTVWQYYVANNSNQFGEAFIFKLPVTMRTTPTLYNSFTNNDNSSLMNSSVTTENVMLRETCGNPTYPYSSFTYSFEVDAEL